MKKYIMIGLLSIAFILGCVSTYIYDHHQSNSDKMEFVSKLAMEYPASFETSVKEEDGNSYSALIADETVFKYHLKTNVSTVQTYNSRIAAQVMNDAVKAGCNVTVTPGYNDTIPADSTAKPVLITWNNKHFLPAIN